MPNKEDAIKYIERRLEHVTKRQNQHTATYSALSNEFWIQEQCYWEKQKEIYQERLRIVKACDLSDYLVVMSL